jgi:hypothetical protein
MMISKSTKVFALIIFISNSLFAQSASLTDQQKSWLEKSNCYEKNGWIYIHLEGAPEGRGFQYGYTLSKEIFQALRATEKTWRYQTAMEWSWLVKKAGEIFTPKVDKEIIEELNGMKDGLAAAGFSTSVDELVTLNGIIELQRYWFPTVKDSIRVNMVEEKKESCSSFIATGNMTADGGIVLGHNTMGSYRDPLCNVIIDILPKKGHRILMQAGPGLVHSATDFFETSAGLVGSETTIGDFFPFDVKGEPEFSRMRHATQYASNIDEWCEIIKRNNNGGYANAWLLGDVNTNEIARLELGLKFANLERTKDGYFIGSNIAEDLKILRFETKSNELNIKNSSVARRVRWKQLMKEYAGKIDLELAKKFEADHYDTYMNKEIPCSRTLCSHRELDAATFDDNTPFIPGGTYDGKVVNSKMAKQMSFMARWGSACGIAFDSKKFLEDHPQFDWMSEILRDRQSQPWTKFTSGENE